MKLRWVVAFAAIAIACMTIGVGSLRAQRKPTAWTHPRTAWGDPDLEGVWTSDNNFSIPLERPPEVANKEFLDGPELDAALAKRAQLIAAVADGGAVGAGPSHWYENLTAKSRRSSLIIDPKNGRLPALTSEARARAAAEQAARAGRGPADSWEDRSLWDRCITVGLPAVMFPTGYNNNVQILQAPGYITITHEMMHDTRIIPLDGSAHLSSRIRQYMGDSRARWEGTTLVVDVTNFHANTNYRGSRDTLHLIERYTRTASDQLRYEVTIDDPKTYVRPFKVAFPITQEPGYQNFEYACHEGNNAMFNSLSGARAQEKKGQ